jgi:hypothetical protein
MALVIIPFALYSGRWSSQPQTVLLLNGSLLAWLLDREGNRIELYQSL